MSLIQKEIADFTVQCYQNNAFRAVSKADILGKWSVFFFYPADFTFVCPTELEDLANLYEKFQAIGCEIYSVSCDTHFVHKAWHDASERIQNIQYAEKDAAACGECLYEGFFTAPVEDCDKLLLRDYAQVLIEKCSFTLCRGGTGWAGRGVRLREIRQSL